MKTLIDSTETSATYEFTQGTATRRVTFTSGPQVTEEIVVPDFESLAEAEYHNWLKWLNIDSLSQPLDENGVEIPQ
jgi:hypothetical protein